MRMTHEERQQMIVEVLAPGSGGATDAEGIAARTLWSWERVAFHLTPLIGEAGFQSLYARAVHLALPQCSGLTAASPAQPLGSLFEKLKRELGQMDASDAARTSKLLLATFTELLSTLIGESLTSRVLHSAWNDKSNTISGKDFRK